MPNEFELKGWLKGLGLADDVVTLIGEKVTDQTVLNNIKGQVMAQSDYSRAMDALRKQETELKAAADAKVKKELDEIANYRSESDGNFKRAQEERVKAEQRLIAVRAQIETLARDYALPNEAIEGLFKDVPAGAPPPPPPAKNDPDPRYMTREQFGTEADAYTRLPIEYAQIAGEYEDLFKSSAYRRADANTLSPIERVLQRSKTDKVPLRAAFEREFNVQAKRDEIREADVTRRITEAAEAARREERTKIAAETPGVSVGRPSNLPHSIALDLAGPGNRKDAQGNPIQAPRMGAAAGHEDRVSKAVGSFWENYNRIVEGDKVA